VAAAVLGAIRAAVKTARAIEKNTAAVQELAASFNKYTHENDTRAEVMQQDIRDLKDWRLQVEAVNRSVAFGAGGAAT